MPPSPDALRADLVLEGGGVKGLALVGAVTGLHDAGYAFPRVAGSSAGAVVACLVAALQKAGEPVDDGACRSGGGGAEAGPRPQVHTVRVLGGGS